MAKTLPAFAPLSLKELRRFWQKYRGNPDIERLGLEVQFSRDMIHDIDVYFVSIHRAWREQNVGELVAIEKVRLLLIQQHLRQGVLAGLMPAPHKRLPPELALLDRPPSTVTLSKPGMKVIASCAAAPTQRRISEHVRPVKKSAPRAQRCRAVSKPLRATPFTAYSNTWTTKVEDKQGTKP